jgi:alpha-glucoside transport system substrate-binding protein
MKRTRRVGLLASLAAMCLLTTGCLQGGESDDGGGGGNGGNEGGTAGAGGSEPGDGVVEIFGAFTGAEQDAFVEALKGFEEESGIDVKYTGNADFTTFVRSRVQGGSPPDIALFPQPGLLLDLARRGDVVPIEEFLDVNELNETLIPGFLDAVTDADGTIYGSPMRMAVKSLVWVPAAYEEADYSLEPASIQELADIGDQIKADGAAPWCIGFEDGAATGWVGTDWIEEMMLRLHGPEVYDQWVNHEIPFDAPEVQEAFDAFGDIALTEGNVQGGGEAIVSQPFGEAGNPSFEDPPACYMHRQGNFITGFFPEEIQQNLDEAVRVMIFPPYEGGYDGQPVLGGGDLAALFNGEDEESKEVMRFLTADDFGAEWAQIGGWLSPHATFDASNYPDETTKTIAELVANADVFRFDASDLMPAEVGAGTFWTGMVDWITGAKSTEDVTAEIEASWPSG